MIVFTLVWWNYLVIGASVFASAYAVTLVESWREARKPNPSYPCLAYMRADRDRWGGHVYCGQSEGHAGPHGDQVMVTYPESVRSEWPVTSAPFGGDDQQ